MTYTAKNYKPTPDIEVIEGEVRVQNGGKITQNGVDFAPAAHQVDSVAADVPTLVADFNALLAKLQAAGLMKTS